MSNTKPQIILVGEDFSGFGEHAFERAAQLAGLAEESEIHVVSVATDYPPMLRIEVGKDVETLSVEDAAKLLHDKTEQRVKDLAERGVAVPAKRVVSHLRIGVPAHEIVQLASDIEADVIVVGTHGRRGLRRFLLGSVAEGVVRNALCSVSIVRPKGYPEVAVPEIEPPCPRCVEKRRETGGEQMWCDQHAEKHGARHTYHFSPARMSISGNRTTL